MNELIATTTTPLLAAFAEAGVLAPADVHVGRKLGLLCGEADERVWLAAALTVRALRAGSVCVELASVATAGFERDEEQVDVAALPWPEPDAWQAAVRDSAMTTVGAEPAGNRPLRLVDGLLYAERYWAAQESVRSRLAERLHRPAPHVDPASLTAALDALFDGAGLAPGEPDRQREAAALAASSWLTVVAGGPGTGKTTALARLLAVLLDQAEAAGADRPRIALAAPTGKAAARMEESLAAQLATLPPRLASPLGSLGASTLHRLLGWLPGSRLRFRHDAGNPLPYDVVVVDELSMVSLTMMARLLEALRPGAKLIMVGDPDQLASVEAGAVLADVVRADALQPGPDGSPAPLPGVVELTHNWRFGSAITRLATAVRTGDAADAVATLTAGGTEIEFVETDLTDPEPSGVGGLRERVVRTGEAVIAAARAGDGPGAVAALDRHRLLCAHRRGPCGVTRWSWQAEHWLAAGIPGFGETGEFAVGTPLLIGANLRDVALYNGDSGVVVATADGPRAAFVRGTDTTMYPPALLGEASPLFAMTVHKAQGSQFDEVSLVLPPPDSPLLTRELLYTAITRAQRKVIVYGSLDAVVAAVNRPARRASGLRSRLC